MQPPIRRPRTWSVRRQAPISRRSTQLLDAMQQAVAYASALPFATPDSDASLLTDLQNTNYELLSAGLGSLLDETVFDPNTGIIAGLLNARDDLATAVLTANDDFPSQLRSPATASGRTCPTWSRRPGAPCSPTSARCSTPAISFLSG